MCLHIDRLAETNDSAAGSSMWRHARQSAQLMQECKAAQATSGGEGVATLTEGPFSFMCAQDIKHVMQSLLDQSLPAIQGLFLVPYGHTAREQVRSRSSESASCCQASVQLQEASVLSGCAALTKMYLPCTAVGLPLTVERVQGIVEEPVVAAGQKRGRASFSSILLPTSSSVSSQHKFPAPGHMYQ